MEKVVFRVHLLPLNSGQIGGSGVVGGLGRGHVVFFASWCHISESY